jgi:hypothetical protein
LLRKSLLTTSHPFLLALLWLIGSGCGTIYRAETRSIARIFSEPPGSTVFVEDDDPALIRDALPFALKTYEALLASDPSNQTRLSRMPMGSSTTRQKEPKPQTSIVHSTS